MESNLYLGSIHKHTKEQSPENTNDTRVPLTISSSQMPTNFPEKNEEYGTLEYWEKRYSETQETSFDWFKGFSDLQSALEEWIPDKDSSILQLGCGNSLLSEDM